MNMPNCRITLNMVRAPPREVESAAHKNRDQEETSVTLCMANLRSQDGGRDVLSLSLSL